MSIYVLDKEVKKGCYQTVNKMIKSLFNLTSYKLRKNNIFRDGTWDSDWRIMRSSDNKEYHHKRVLEKRSNQISFIGESWLCSGGLLWRIAVRYYAAPPSFTNIQNCLAVDRWNLLVIVTSRKPICWKFGKTGHLSTSCAHRWWYLGSSAN